MARDLSRKEALLLAAIGGGGLGLAIAELALNIRLANHDTQLGNALSTAMTGWGKSQEVQATLATTANGLQDQLLKEQTENEILRVTVLDRDLQATQEAWEMLPYRVQATSEAYQSHPDKLAEELRDYPQTVKSNAVSLKIFYKKGDVLDQYGTGGSGIVTNIDNQGVVTILTAAHVLERAEVGVEVSDIIVEQPHKQETQGQGVWSVAPTIAIHPTRDVALIRVQMDTSLFRTGQYPMVDKITIDGKWTPQFGETLYSISFPTVAQTGIGFVPSKFEVTRSPIGDGVDVITNSVVHFGSSGGAICRKDGSVVGVYVSESPLGTLVLPLKEAYDQLISQMNVKN